jgi:hypothetical protein
MASNFSRLSKTLGNLGKEGNRNSMFAFVNENSPTRPQHICKSPVAALMSLKDWLAKQSSHPDVSELTFAEVVSGRYQLVEFHLFVKFNDEHILAQSESRRGLPLARRQPRREDASRALPTSIYGHPPIDYEGLPRDEDL